MADVEKFTLTPKHKMIALLMARGHHTQKAIADEMGVSDQWISLLKRRPEFMEQVREYQIEIKDNILERALRVEELFNEESEYAFRTLKALHRAVDSEGHPDGSVPAAVRRGAARDILDYSTEAPNPAKRKEEKEGDRHLHIHLPQRTMDCFKEALEDVIEAQEEEYGLLEENQG